MARIIGAPLRSVQRTAIELCTAAGVVGMLELLHAGRLPARGFVRQEQVALQDFLATRAGRCYAALADPANGPVDVDAAHVSDGLPLAQGIRFG